MAGLDVTWETTEDGMMLVQLMGERADVLFGMDHLLYSASFIYVIVALVAVAAAVLCLCAFPSEGRNGRGPEPHRARSLLLCAVAIAAAAILACAVLTVAWDIRLDARLANIDARIEAIRIRHPEWGFRGAVYNRLCRYGHRWMFRKR